MLMHAAGGVLLKYTRGYTHGIIMPITRIFRNGNSQAIRIPAELAYPETETEVEIERIGDELRIHPVRRSLAGALDRFKRFDSDFMASGRNQPEQDDREFF
ncbi:SpoVT/AbrB-like protein [Caballeronia cordobensis]|uniref:SpoVT/AbrB-like protein n=2 Tax=Caballeronia cordobensis TaxID=1353886 RepID=A0A158GLA4_CABCO|nr:SpoVT/AbrB-like protein [Caballeronia cordobensis]